MKVIGFDVDTQVDFMYGNGNLPVNGAESIIPVLKEVTQYLEKNGIQRLASADAHTLKELKTNVEFLSTETGGYGFPMHCRKGTPGYQRIHETQMPKARQVANREYQDVLKFLKPTPNLVFEKQSFDVFDNPNTTTVLDELGTDIAFVYGVATDYCVLAAAKGLRKHGMDVYLVTDAIQGIDVNPGDVTKCLEEMSSESIQRTTSEDLLKIDGSGLHQITTEEIEAVLRGESV